MPVALGCSALALQMLAAAQQPGRFRSSAELVLVDVQVRQGRTPVANLTASDFELRDNGVVQRIQSATFEQVPISALLVLDVSGSVRGETLTHLKAAVHAAATALTEDDQNALLTISDRIVLRSPWSRDRVALGRTVDALMPSGATALADGIYTALGLRNDADGRTLLIVFSDGADTSSWLDPMSVVQAARGTDVVVYGVMVAPQLVAQSSAESLPAIRQRASLQRWFESEPTLFPEMLLERVAGDTGGEVLYASTSGDLPAVFKRIVQDFKSRYLLTFTPTTTLQRGWHSLDVKLKRRAGTVLARPGYAR